MGSNFDESMKALDVWRRRLPGRIWCRLTLPRDLSRMLNIDAPRGRDELLALYELGRSASADGSIVEIGSFRGSSTVALALGARAGNRPRIYAIDPYEHFTGELGRDFSPADRVRLLKNLLRADVAEDVWLIHLPSQAAVKAWSAPISLLWIDGDHSYEGVRADFQQWSPFVIPGGSIAFDDSLDADVGPFRVIQEALAGGQYQRVAVHGKITVIRPNPT